MTEPIRVLVAYASKHGATAEIAEAVASTLRQGGLVADCAMAREVGSLESYGAVVLGSAVYTGRWRREARHFLRGHSRELSTLPFWVFSSGPVGDPEGDKPGWIEPAHMIKTAEHLGVREHVVFGGRLPEEPHGFGQRAMLENTPPEYRDRRDWDEIRAWSAGVAAELRSAAPACA